MTKMKSELGFEKLSLDRQIYKSIIQLKASLLKELTDKNHKFIEEVNVDVEGIEDKSCLEHSLCKSRILDFQELLKTEYRNRCKFKAAIIYLGIYAYAGH